MEVDEKKYSNWLDKMVGLIYRSYYCKIDYPKDMWDLASTKDGLMIKFENIDWQILISNFALYTFYNEHSVKRADLMIGYVRRYVEKCYLRMIKKY